MPVGRLADLGLTDLDGINDSLKRQFDRHVEFDADGYPTKYNFKRWDSDALDTFTYALQRAEAQELTRALVGEMPRWINHPAMQIATQFRKIPILSQNKHLARNMAFGDRTAVTQALLNTAFAMAVRGGKIAGIAAGYSVIKGTEFTEEFDKRWDNRRVDSISPGDMDKYINSVGIWSEVATLQAIAGKIAQSDNSVEDLVSEAINQIPMLGPLHDAAATGKALSEGDMDNALSESQGVMYLGNTAVMDFIYTMAEEIIKE